MRQPRSIRSHLAIVFLFFFLLVIILGLFSISRLSNFNMVSENIAREYWHDASEALGKRIRVGTNDEWREIVGVVGDVHDDGVNQKPPTSVYWPLLQDHFEGDDVSVRRDVAFVIRSSRAGSERFLKDVREALWSVNANLPLASVHTVDYYYRKSLARTSFTLIMLGVAGSMALLAFFFGNRLLGWYLRGL